MACIIYSTTVFVNFGEDAKRYYDKMRTSEMYKRFSVLFFKKAEESHLRPRPHVSGSFLNPQLFLSGLKKNSIHT